MNIGVYVRLAHHSETQLAEAFLQVSDHHRDEPDVEETCRLLSSWSKEKSNGIRPFIATYGEPRVNEPETLFSDLFQGPRTGGLALLRDLHDLWLLATEAMISWTVLLQASRALRDEDLEHLCTRHITQTDRQLAWLQTRTKQAAPQALVVA
ncbi:MAG: hypothetical protein KF854_13365 [Nitrospira sp.]|nr:hypothetical protein [Nitrospira sp.]HNA85332.1 hypothetical protein [Nitrospira sp.]